MQLVSIDNNTTLFDLKSLLHLSNSDIAQVLNSNNNLQRCPTVGKVFYDECDRVANLSLGGIVENTTDNKVAEKTLQRKINILNTLVGDSDIFEAAALLDTRGWNILSAMGTLPGMLKIPDNISIPQSVISMGNGQHVSERIYTEVMDSIAANQSVEFAEYSSRLQTIGSDNYNSGALTASNSQIENPMNWFRIPWGKITIYSSLSNETMDFPVYPEELAQMAKAEYTTMPDLLYQYEPWQLYKSSGPREQKFTFDFHRDMWTGDHRDGMANKLIRFCEANCYPDYNGSAVLTPTVTLYINGSAFINGIMTSVNTTWKGPLGLDNWYLECVLELNIIEVSKVPLNYNVVREKPLIG